jgi:heme-degrading monooxygenase HmoA
MQATFFFLARHTSREAPVAGEAQIRAGRGAIARTLALVPRADLGFDRGSYCTGDYQRVDITSGLSMQAPASALDIVVQCEQIRKMRGQSPAVIESCFLVTACKVESAQNQVFLGQFDRAAAYMRNRPGFVRLRLFQSLDDAAVFRFINVAQWRSMPDFIAAFGAPEFKALVQGGFDYSSQIIVADASAAVGRNARP